MKTVFDHFSVSRMRRCVKKKVTTMIKCIFSFCCRRDWTKLLVVVQQTFTMQDTEELCLRGGMFVARVPRGHDHHMGASSMCSSRCFHPVPFFLLSGTCKESVSRKHQRIGQMFPISASEQIFVSIFMTFF